MACVLLCAHTYIALAPFIPIVFVANYFRELTDVCSFLQFKTDVPDRRLGDVPAGGSRKGLSPSPRCPTHLRFYFIFVIKVNFRFSFILRFLTLVEGARSRANWGSRCEEIAPYYPVRKGKLRIRLFVQRTPLSLFSYSIGQVRTRGASTLLQIGAQRGAALRNFF